MSTSKDVHIMYHLLSVRIQKSLLVQHAILLHECPIHEVILPDQPVQRGYENPGSFLLIVKAWFQLLHEMLLGIWHYQGAEICIHQLVQSFDALTFEEIISFASGYRKELSELFGIVVLFVSQSEIAIVIW